MTFFCLFRRKRLFGCFGDRGKGVSQTAKSSFFVREGFRHSRMEGILSELQGALEILFCNAPGRFCSDGW